MTPQKSRADPGNPVRHELINALTVICGRAQLLHRAVSRSASVSDEEQATLAAGLAAIEAAVWTAVAVIDERHSEHGTVGGDGRLPES
jgi:hypothetical protein